MTKKKLIEVALPLEAINAQSAREKSIRHGHPSTLHLWWARRPLATARAVLFAQLVDDPSEDADRYREEAQRSGIPDIAAYVDTRVTTERERLFELITRMVNWDNLNDEALFDEVRAEILKSTDGAPPAILDPFAGGGTIPLEAQRLGLDAYSSDLNPVAVLINKALIEIPQKFVGRNPVYPGAADTRNAWPKTSGLTEDVRRYGEWMRDEAFRRVGDMYPKAKLSDGTEASVIAWIWARTVTCPNPTCGIDTPLVRSWWLGKKKGKEAYVVPTVSDGKVDFTIGSDPSQAPERGHDGSIKGGNAICVGCRLPIANKYIRSQANDLGLGETLIATVAAGHRRRIYLAPTAEHRLAAAISRPAHAPDQMVTTPNHDVDRLPMYGMPRWSDAFTNRQLKSLVTFSDLVSETRERVLEDALSSGLLSGKMLDQGGTEAAAYADAVATYLAIIVSRLTDYSSSITTWASNPQMEILRNVFARQAVPMAWDFAEGNPFASSSGGLEIMTKAVTRALENVPASSPASATQDDASTRSYAGLLISTDPPYYDNIGYSELSDFFYIWLRRSLRDVYPELFSTLLVPKAEELVANPYRHGGRAGAQSFFEHGFQHVFSNARAAASLDFPITVYYAFKQAELESDGLASTGWETLLSGMLRAGWSITATWPVRSERAGRMISIGTNALASSIVLALRPRPDDAAVTDRRSFLAELKASLPGALRSLQQGSIAPVDMAQAAIGPGMAIFSKYSSVIEPSGEHMSVRDALRAINGVLDEVLSLQEADFDDDTRWCVAWFTNHGFDSAGYGEAETLASAKNASVASLARSGAISSGGGLVRLLSPDELPSDYDPRTDDRISLWEVVLHLARALSEQGLDASGRILAGADARGFDTTAAHELAYLAYSIAERRGLTRAGVLFNTLASSWPEVRSAADSSIVHSKPPTASTLDLDGLEN
ncbi:DUF1156 domain-containing protein [Pseudoclavibacter helvolus]|uniref:DUF1156 domain-containing protein n=1 Tax=Pseudoclavibacter helvolus TaxID=255205 RepID=UPI0008382EE1|nr:DUF1156 domain-containing protein [Pseudoclavibacter helvolus]